MKILSVLHLLCVCVCVCFSILLQSNVLWNNLWWSIWRLFHDILEKLMLPWFNCSRVLLLIKFLCCLPRSPTLVCFMSTIKYSIEMNWTYLSRSKRLPQFEKLVHTSSIYVCLIPKGPTKFVFETTSSHREIHKDKLCKPIVEKFASTTFSKCCKNCSKIDWEDLKIIKFGWGVKFWTNKFLVDLGCQQFAIIYMIYQMVIYYWLLSYIFVKLDGTYGLVIPKPPFDCSKEISRRPSNFGPFNVHLRL